MLSLTALILTRNEQENIARTLEALRWVPKVLVIDSISTDETTEIAQSFPNVRVVQRSFDTHASQWNFGLDQTDTDWVLTLDADYILSRELAEEVGSLEPVADAVGYWAEFRYCVSGQPLRVSIYPPRVVLFRTKQGRYVDEGHTQQLRIAGRIEKLHGRILHDDRKPLSRWIASQDRYAELEAEYLHGARSTEASRQDKIRKMMFVAPLIMPLYLLFGRGLILDGWRGWHYVLQRTTAEMMLSLRLLEKKFERSNENAEKLR